jgi:hypothetical protein
MQLFVISKSSPITKVPLDPTAKVKKLVMRAGVLLTCVCTFSPRKYPGPIKTSGLLMDAPA